MGVDGWKGGWIAVVLEGGVFTDAACAPGLKALLDRFQSVNVVGVDMPIGFPTSEPRRADFEARTFVGARRSSVFPMLPRPVYETESYADALEACERLWRRGLSRQSYALKTKILEVESIVVEDSRLIEVHPEVTFAAMAGEPLVWSKKTWNGQMRRRALLAEQGVVLPDDLGEAGRVPVDDVIDAAACAWSAERVRLKRCRTLPAEPAEAEPTIVY